MRGSVKRGGGLGINMRQWVNLKCISMFLTPARIENDPGALMAQSRFAIDAILELYKQLVYWR